MTSSQAAAALGISTRRVRYLAARGCLPGAYRPGRDWLIPLAAIEERQAAQRKERG
ncbi:helix-turn-helix domain-containing protein [Labedaea rhizosphaerae]|uniref:helix-turn-helix domain-containing protein n=1 Tax=Labedaea rhizosphaerae TaxID=598644 RepID=UPI00141528C8